MWLHFVLSIFTRIRASVEAPPKAPNLYSYLSTNSCIVRNGTRYFSTLRNAMRFPLYVAVIITVTSNQQRSRMDPCGFNDFRLLPFAMRTLIFILFIIIVSFTLSFWNVVMSDDYSFRKLHYFSDSGKSALLLASVLVTSPHPSNCSVQHLSGDEKHRHVGNTSLEQEDILRFFS